MHFLSQPIDVLNEVYSLPAIISNSDDKSKENEYHKIETNSDKWIELSCQLAVLSVENNGGPFGAVILQIESKSQKILRYWEASNKVTLINDPTAHAEVLAIRSACNSLGVYDLGKICKSDSKLPQVDESSYCILYSSCEPCPMCFSAVSWARIPYLFFAATRYDAGQPGVEFSDKDIYDELEKPYHLRKTSMFRCQTSNYLDAFELWKNTEHKKY
jgi:tRNA(Arg) A34 adenosine deaminase TadA